MAGWNRPDKLTHAKRVREVALMLSQGYYQGQIKQHVCSKYQVHWRTAMNYIRHARNAMMEDFGLTKRQMQASALAFWRAIVQDEKISLAKRMKAQERIEKILGLEEPTVVHSHISGGTSNTVKVEYQDEWTKQRFDLSLDDSSHN